MADVKTIKIEVDEEVEPPIVEQVPLSSLSHLTVNFAFVRRAWRIIGLGLHNPRQAPWLWTIILFNMAFQIAGAYLIQSQLYIIATGRDTAYPGIAGCLKNGCGGRKAPGDPDTVLYYFRQFAWSFVLCMIFVILMTFTGDIIKEIMRKNISSSTQRRLLKDKLLYRLTADGTLDNVDQRMTTDLQVVLDGFTCVLFGNSADFLAYPVVFMIGRFSFSMNNVFSLPELQDPDLRGRVMGIVYAAVSVAFAAYILPINHVSKIFFRGQMYEGDLRTSHTRAVLNCEQISLLRGEPAERHLTDAQYKRVDGNLRVYYVWQGVLLILRLFVTITMHAVSYIALAVMGTSNSTTANFFQKQYGDVLEYWLLVPVLLERLAFACGATHRVGQVLESIDFLEANPLKQTVEHNDNKIELRGVFANPPSLTKSTIEPQDSLFHGVNLTVDHGKSVCIVGPSGCGKSSLLRVIGGLWGTDEGTVVRPAASGRDGIFFLPQKPYVFPGSLQAQVEYPAKPSDLQRSAELLRKVHLGHLVEKYGMEGTVDWNVMLSISEMQRLNFARMFFHQPRFCLADECTSALDLRLESFLYGECTKSGISMISVAHRATVIPHHDFVFQFEKSTKSWSLVPAAQVKTCEKFPIDGLENLQETGGILQMQEPCEELEGFNLKFLRRLARAVGLGMRSCRSQAVAFLFIMFICMCIYGGMTIIIFRNYGTSAIIAKIVGSKAIPRNVPSALNDSGVIIGLNAVVSVVQALSCYLGSLVALKIQRAIVGALHRNYFTPGVVYHTNRVINVRGVDQRIVQDVMGEGGLRESLSWLLGSPFSFCNYRVGFLPLMVCWLILTGYAFSQNWHLTLFFLGFMVMAYLSQAFSSNFTSKAVGSRQAAEGVLRLHIGRILQNIESITFFGGQLEELAAADAHLEALFHARLRYSYLAICTSIPTISFFYWLQAGVYVMAGLITVFWAPGAINSADLFTTINFNLIWSKVTQLIIMCMGGFGMVIGFTHRVMSTVEKVEEARLAVEENQKKIHESQGVVFDGVSITTPGASGSRLLVQDFSLDTKASVCINGHSKTSIMRALAGLWPTAKGTISAPAFGRDGIFFVPQMNYATQGTLAAQVVYPKLVSEVESDDAALREILKEVGMGDILERWGLHKVVNWDFVLSGGECQRLGFARVLFHKPRVAVLDETSSALDTGLERRCMEAVVKRGIKLISFSTRPWLSEYHEQQLQVKKDGTVDAKAPVQAKVDEVYNLTM